MEEIEHEININYRYLLEYDISHIGYLGTERNHMNLEIKEEKDWITEHWRKIREHPNFGKAYLNIKVQPTAAQEIGKLKRQIAELKAQHEREKKKWQSMVHGVVGDVIV